MKWMCIALMMFSFVSARAGAEVFSGTWSGQGKFDSSSLNQAVDARFNFEVKVDAKTLHLRECWTTGSEGHGCITSDYQLENDDQIYTAGRKIGDIFPDHILILNANHQVAEQIQLEANAAGSLRYQYSYVNLDGASIHRKVILTRAPALRSKR